MVKVHERSVKKYVLFALDAYVYLFCVPQIVCIIISSVENYLLNHINPVKSIDWSINQYLSVHSIWDAIRFHFKVNN